MVPIYTWFTGYLYSWQGNGPPGCHNSYSCVVTMHALAVDPFHRWSMYDRALATFPVELKNHLVLLRKYVCRQAYGKGRALLEALGLTKAQIAKYYGMYPQNEEEAVQDGLQAWIGGSLDSTWSDLLEAMETAGIDIQQREGLKEELCSNAGT